MKLEKLNENQIRCTLTREDLANRHLNLLELAYGSERAKSLFREMLQQAAYEFGFEVDNIPIMIEAVPMSSDSLVLIITKVEDPEELDARFAKYAPDGDGESALAAIAARKLEGADDILNLLRKIRDGRKSAQDAPGKPSANGEGQQALPADLTRLYCFDTLDDVIQAACVLDGSYRGENSLYRHPDSGEYYLFLRSCKHTPEEFNRICNTVAEYGASEKYTAGILGYLAEHGVLILGKDALQTLVNVR